MEKLDTLPSISQLSKSVVRILGQNPGKFTLQGTNTYVIGRTNPYTLIDTGEGRSEYIPILESALRETVPPINPTQPDISDIVISHWHPDHVGGIPSVLTLLRRLWLERNPELPFVPPRLHKFPDDPKATSTVKAHGAIPSLPSIIASLPKDAFTPTSNGRVFHDLHDSQVLALSNLHVIHTPGHTADSISLYIGSDKALYTADTVLGQGTAVFEDLSAYMQSLKKMLNFSEQYIAVYPGHGPVVADGKVLINQYIQHRLEREGQILNLLKSPLSISPTKPLGSTSEPSPEPGLPSSSESKQLSTWDIVRTLYAAYPESLWLPAAHSVNLHLRKLEDDGVVRRVGGEAEHSLWEVVDILNAEGELPVDRTSSA